MFNITINKYLIEWAYRIGKKEYIESDQINNTSKFDFGQCQSYFHEIKPWSITIEGKAPVIIRTNINDGVATNNSELTFRHTAKWKVMLWYRIKAAFYVCFCSHLISEYYVPYIIATLPLAWLLMH